MSGDLQVTHCTRAGYNLVTEPHMPESTRQQKHKVEIKIWSIGKRQLQ